MIILRQREFGNKQNKAAKKALEMSLADGKSPEDIARLRQELRDGVMIGGTIKTKNGNTQSFDFNTPNRNTREAELDRRINRRGKTTASGGANVYKAGYKDEYEFGTALRDQKLKNSQKTKAQPIIPQQKPKSNPNPTSNASINSKSTGTPSPNKKLSFNVGQFVKNNKVGLGIGAAAIGTGAYLLHKHNKKKREEEENKKSK